MIDKIQSIKVNNYLSTLTSAKASRYKIFLKYLYFNTFFYKQFDSYFFIIKLFSLCFF